MPEIALRKISTIAGQVAVLLRQNDTPAPCREGDAVPRMAGLLTCGHGRHASAIHNVLPGIMFGRSQKMVFPRARFRTRRAFSRAGGDDGTSRDWSASST